MIDDVQFETTCFHMRDEVVCSQVHLPSGILFRSRSTHHDRRGGRSRVLHHGRQTMVQGRRSFIHFGKKGVVLTNGQVARLP